MEHVARELTGVGIREQRRNPARDQRCGRGRRNVEAYGVQQGAVLFHRRHVKRIGAETHRNQQRLHRDRACLERIFQFFVQDALVRRVHVHDHQAVPVLRQHEDAGELGQGEAEGRVGRLRWCGLERRVRNGARAEQRLVERRGLGQPERHAAAPRAGNRRRGNGGACAATNFGARAGDGLRERAVKRVKDELMHATRVAETHFGLGRVHVDVHLRGLDLEEQHEGRMAVMVQHVLVGLADRVSGELVAHAAAVDKEILRLARGTRVRRQPDGSVKPQPGARFVEREGRGVEILAQQRADALAQRLGLEMPLRPAVMLQREAGLRTRERDALERFFAVGVLGCLGFEKPAARRGVEIKIAHLDAGAAPRRGRRDLGELGAARGNGPGVLVSGAAAGEGEVGDGRDARERLAAKTQSRHAFQILERGDLAGGVA